MNGVDGVVERGMQEQKLSKDIQKVETMKQPSRKHRRTVDWKIAGQSIYRHLNRQQQHGTLGRQWTPG